MENLRGEYSTRNPGHILHILRRHMRITEVTLLNPLTLALGAGRDLEYIQAWGYATIFSSHTLSYSTYVHTYVKYFGDLDGGEISCRAVSTRDALEGYRHSVLRNLCIYS